MLATTRGEDASYMLPVNWNELKDGSTGRTYYWNMDTGQTSWERPVGPKAKPMRGLTKAHSGDTAALERDVRTLEEEKVGLTVDLKKEMEKGERAKDAWQAEKADLEKQIRMGGNMRRDSMKTEGKFAKDREDLRAKLKAAQAEMHTNWEKWEAERKQLRSQLDSTARARDEAKDGSKSAFESELREARNKANEAEQQSFLAKEGAAAAHDALRAQTEELAGLRRTVAAIKDAEANVAKAQAGLEKEQAYHEATLARFKAFKTDAREAQMSAARRYDEAQNQWTTERQKMRDEMTKLRDVVRQVSSIISVAS